MKKSLISRMKLKRILFFAIGLVCWYPAMWMDTILVSDSSDEYGLFQCMFLAFGTMPALVVILHFMLDFEISTAKLLIACSAVYLLIGFVAYSEEMFQWGSSEILD